MRSAERGGRGGRLLSRSMGRELDASRASRFQSREMRASRRQARRGARSEKNREREGCLKLNLGFTAERNSAAYRFSDI